MELRFDDYNAYPDSDIREVTETGIHLSTGQWIDFAVCAENFYRIRGGSGKCVGEREISGPDCTIAFYTAPLTTHIVFFKYPKFRRLLGQLSELGYTTYDAS